MLKTATEKMDVKFHDVDKSTFKATSKPLQDEFKNNPDTKADYKLIEKEEQRYEKAKQIIDKLLLTLAGITLLLWLFYRFINF